MTVPISSLTDTWNASGTAFTAIGMNVTDTGHAAGSKLLDLQVGGTSKFSVAPSGDFAGVCISTDNSSTYSISLGAAAGNHPISSGIFNNCFGVGAGNALTSGTSNVIVGTSAGAVLTSGSNNIFIGSDNGTTRAGGNITTTGNNIILGPYAGVSGLSNTVVLADGAAHINLWSNSTSTSFGYLAGNNPTAASAYNTSLGVQAGLGMSTASGNTLVGTNAGAALSTGSFNTLIGSLNGSNYAGGSITTGSNNTIIGPYMGTAAMARQVMLADGTGVLGFWVENDLSSNLNVGVGSGAGNYSGRSGFWCVSIGSRAGEALTSGFGNTLIGTNSGLILTSGNNNIFIGGYNNVSGLAAGSSVTTGSNNVVIGPYTGTSTMANQVLLADGAGNFVVAYDQPNKLFLTPTTTVSALPAAGTIGRRAFVTDANASTFFTVAAGSGSNKVPVFDDGTNWRIG